MRLISLICVLAAALSVKGASLEGVVTNQETGQPLSDVHIRLILSDGMNGRVAYGAITGQSGRFSVTGLPPGRYSFSASLPGFLQLPYNGFTQGAPLTISNSEPLSPYMVKMVPRALLAGRILDEFGDPVRGVRVFLQEAESSGAPVSQRQAIPQKITNDRGEFRLAAPPGRYYLVAEPMPAPMTPAPEIRTDGSSLAPYKTTYFPGVDRSQARLIEAGPGEDVVALDFHITREAAPGHLFTISGTVTGAPQDDHAMVIVRYRETPNSGTTNGLSVQADFNGRFFLRGSRPGYYIIFAEYTYGQNRFQSPPLEIRLTDSDQTGLSLPLMAGEDLAGRIQVVGDVSPGGADPVFRVSLEAADLNSNMASLPSAETARDGSFRIRNVFPGRFRVRVTPMPANASVDSLTLSGAPVRNSILDFSHGVLGASLRIVVSTNGGELSGKLFDPDGQLSNTPAVVLFWTDTDNAYPQTRSVRAGSYSIKPLRSGRYRVLAIGGREFSQALSNMGRDAALSTLQSMAQDVEIPAGGHVEKDLKIVSKEDIHVAPKQ